MRTVHEPGKSGSKKDGFKSKEPMKEGRFSRLKKAAAVALGIMVIPAVIMLSTVRCVDEYTVTGSKTDSGVMDASVDSGDSTGLDADIKDVDVPDSRPDVAQLDSAVDSSIVDAETPDASLIEDGGPGPDTGVDSGVDSGIDAGATCPGVFNQSVSTEWININTPYVLGGYKLTYTTELSATSVSLDIHCDADNSSVALGEVFDDGAERVVYLPAGDKNLRLTVVTSNANNIVVNAAIESP